MSDEAMTDEQAASAIAALVEAGYELINKLPLEDRMVAQLAADAGEGLVIHPEDGGFRLEFAGYRLGTVWVTQ